MAFNMMMCRHKSAGRCVWINQQKQKSCGMYLWHNDTWIELKAHWTFYILIKVSLTAQGPRIQQHMFPFDGISLTIMRVISWIIFVSLHYMKT